jgi:hypothetical protein
MWISWGQGWYNNNIICHYLSPNVTGSAGKSVMIIKWLFRALNSMSNYRHYKPKQNQCLPGTRNGWKGGLLCRLILERWQTMQLRAKDKQSFLMFGQTNRSQMSRCVALPPGWAILCTVSNILLRRGSGTKGRTVCLATSHHTEGPPLNEHFISVRAVVLFLSR